MHSDPLLYRVSFPDLAGHRIHVSLDIAQPSPEGQTLFLPAWIPGSYLIRDFSRQVESIRAHSNGTPCVIQKTANHTWVCEPCAGPLTIEYVIYAWDLSVRSAHVDESHAFFNGTSVFLGALGQEHLPCTVELTAPPQQPNWKVYTSLPEANAHPNSAVRHAFGAYQAANYDDLIDHPFELGTPQYISFEAGGALHEMVFTGLIPNLDLERIARDCQTVCEAQIALFDPEQRRAPFLESADRYVFMTMVTDNDYGGLEHRSSTALMASRSDLPTLNQQQEEKSAGYLTFLGLVSHEYFHTWHVKRIKPAAFVPYRYLTENHTDLLWVFEGFTSYYDDALLWRSGTITEKEYFSLLKKNIDAVHRAGGRFKQSIAESSFDTWTRFYKQDENSPNALVSYYSKGALVALGLNLYLQQQSNGQHNLDDVMRLLWQRYGKNFYSNASQQGVEEADMPALILEATGIDCSNFIQRYAYGREDVPLEALLATQGISLRWESASALPSLDARLVNSASGLKVATVYEGGAAHLAGVSAGDHLVALDGLRISNQDTLDKLLSAYSVNDTVCLHVFRRDELRAYQLCLSAAPKNVCTLTRNS